MKKNNVFVKIIIGILVTVLVIFGLMFFAVSRLLSKMQVTDISRYQEEFEKKGMAKFNLFPESIPESATDVKFASYYALQSHEGGFYLEMTLPEDELNELIDSYEVFVEDDFSSYPQKVRDFGMEGYEVYSDYYYGRGFVVNRDANRIMYFYDEHTCGSN